jgi:hypothetical protein
MDPCWDVSPGCSVKKYRHPYRIQNDLLFSHIRNREQSTSPRSVTSFDSVIYPRLTVIQSEYVARALSDYLTAEAGAKIIFESAIVPKWKDSRISFKNVYFVRRPAVARDEPQSGVQATAIGYDIINHPLVHGNGEEEEEPHLLDLHEEDTNYTQFDLTIDSIDVTLSLWRWLDGKGLVKDAVVKGVRGILGELFLLPMQGVSSCSRGQTVGRLLGTLTIHSTRPYSDIAHSPGTSNWNHSSWKMFWSRSTNQEDSDHTLHLSSGLTSARSENNGCFMISFLQRISWVSSITACLVCTNRKALDVPMNKIYRMECGPGW